MTISIESVEFGDSTVTTTLTDGTVVKHYYHVCDTCTSVDTWIVGPPDKHNTTADTTRRNVRGFAWNRNGGRQNLAGITTSTLVLDKETND